MLRSTLKKRNIPSKLFGYWATEFYYVHEDENSTNLPSEKIHVLSKKLDKQLISSVLALFLNFTIFVPVTRANTPEKNLHSDLVEYCVSKKLKKTFKQNSKKRILYSQKKDRKDKQLAERISRAILRKKYIFLNQQFKKLNPSFNNVDKSLVFSKNTQLSKTSTVLNKFSEKKQNIILRIKNQRIRSLRSGTNSNSDKKDSSNISSSVLKKYIAKLIKKLEFITTWIDKNPTLFSMGIVANVSLIYLYKNGYFIEAYNLIRNSSPRFFELARSFNNYFQEEKNYPFSFYEKVHQMDPEYFNKDYLKEHQADFSILKKYVLMDETPALHVEEQPNFFSSSKQVEREPSIEDYTDHFEYWKIIADLNAKDNQD